MKSRVARVGKDPCWGSERPWPGWLLHRTVSFVPADTRTWVTVLAVLFHSTMSAPVPRSGDSSDHPLWVNPCNLPDDASGHADHLSPQDVRNMLDAVANRARVASEEADKAKRRFAASNSDFGERARATVRAHASSRRKRDACVAPRVERRAYSERWIVRQTARAAAASPKGLVFPSTHVGQAASSLEVVAPRQNAGEGPLPERAKPTLPRQRTGALTPGQVVLQPSRRMLCPLCAASLPAAHRTAAWEPLLQADDGWHRGEK
ncbi:hypothetical protein HPB52_023290 [Rhipicephalus sanguineus]|uniref:Uncharacterized protein n=1 Tax=Rhipicephalus sanguineus TaxID=34632 RepID=A0A9D4TBW2_RHISA|nr:hypothetical protein HPB52_023290 [Rhipicephalus sanguineus]